MATRIVHISDLHFPARNERQVDALAHAITQASPDLLVVTGDLTQFGRRSEFQEAADFFRLLPGRKLVVPGNHDVPVPGIIARLRSPFGRFVRYFPNQPHNIETSDVLVVGLNTAAGVQLRSDWSLGVASAKSISLVSNVLRELRRDRIGIVACHHPLRVNPDDLQRSRTQRGEEAFKELAQAGMNLLLHGHLHRAVNRCIETPGDRVCEICANTALSNRERAGPAGFNIVDIDHARWELTVNVWREGAYAREIVPSASR